MPSIETIATVDPDAARRLRRSGVRTCEGLLDAGADTRGRRTLATTTGLRRDDVLAWVHQADLMRVRGVSGRHAALLAAAGVATLDDLADREPAALAMALGDVAASTGRRRPSAPTVADWVDQARSLPPAVLA